MPFLTFVDKYRVLRRVRSPLRSFVEHEDTQLDEVREAPVIRKPSQYEKGVQVELDEQIRVEVPVSGTPRPEIQWLKDSKLLTTDKRVQTDFVEDKAILTINKATSDDAGIYTIVAENDAGEDEVEIIVEVTGWSISSIVISIASFWTTEIVAAGRPTIVVFSSFRHRKKLMLFVFLVRLKSVSFQQKTGQINFKS